MTTTRGLLASGLVAAGLTMGSAMVLAQSADTQGAQPGGQSATQNAQTAQAGGGDAEKGEKVFNQCKACHSVKAGENKVGPSLHGVVGRKSGTAPGFNYSDAMKKADLTWDEATLDKYLTDPKATVPGNKMAFAGLKNPDDRKNVIAYLAKEGSEKK
ncbi:MAG: c-type cytochrome [Actinomycetota bacterium]